MQTDEIGEKKEQEVLAEEVGLAVKEQFQIKDQSYLASGLDKFKLTK